MKSVYHCIMQYIPVFHAEIILKYLFIVMVSCYVRKMERMKNSGNMCVTTIWLDCNTLEQLRIAAAKEHRTMRVIVNSLVSDYLKGHKGDNESVLAAGKNSSQDESTPRIVPAFKGGQYIEQHCNT